LDSPDNTAWTDDYLLDWVTEKSEDTQSILTEYTDEDLEINKLIAYRVESFDSNEGPTSVQDRLDSFNSSSEQSLIFNETGFTISSIVNGIITTTTEHNINNGSYIALKDTTSNDGYYFVEAITNNLLKLQDLTINDTSGTVHQAFGIIQIQ
jgi:hypothetical protein